MNRTFTSAIGNRIVYYQMINGIKWEVWSIIQNGCIYPYYLVRSDISI